MRRAAIGIDVGGTGIKGAAVDPSTGERLTKRYRVPTPAGGHPDDILGAIAQMVQEIRAELTTRNRAAAQADPAPAQADPAPAQDSTPDPSRLPIGVALPGVVRAGAVQTAANIDPSWIGFDAAGSLAEVTGVPCAVVNDADAAAVAEAELGAAAGLPGVTMVLTFGTGIGSGCVSDGRLVPNFELGHLELDGYPDIEQHASSKAIEREGLELSEWAERAARYVRHLERVLHPDRFVLGGSISKASDRYLPFAGVTAPVLPARFKNNAGIVGAARLAWEAASASS